MRTKTHETTRTTPATGYQKNSQELIKAVRMTGHSGMKEFRNGDLSGPGGCAPELPVGIPIPTSPRFELN